MSHSTQPVFGTQGSTRKVVGSAIIRKSAPPSISGMSKPPPAVNTGKMLRWEVSLARSVVVMLLPLRSALAASLAITVLPRRMPCWSGNDSRTTSRRCSSISFSALTAASNCASVHKPWRSTKLLAVARSCDDDICLLPHRRLVDLLGLGHRGLAFHRSAGQAPGSGRKMHHEGIGDFFHVGRSDGDLPVAAH